MSVPHAESVIIITDPTFCHLSSPSSSEGPSDTVSCPQKETLLPPVDDTTYALPTGARMIQPRDIRDSSTPAIASLFRVEARMRAKVCPLTRDAVLRFNDFAERSERPPLGTSPLQTISLRSRTPRRLPVLPPSTPSWASRKTQHGDNYHARKPASSHLVGVPSIIDQHIERSLPASVASQVCLPERTAEALLQVRTADESVLPSLRGGRDALATGLLCHQTDTGPLTP